MKLVKKTTDRFPFALEELFNTDWFGGSTGVHRIGINIPAVNIRELDDAFSIALAVPGFKKEDIEIELDKDTLTITAKEVAAEEKVTYARQEFSYAGFKRAFHLPDSANQTAIEAGYDAGILTITIPKKEEAKVLPKRQITIGE